MLDNNSRLIQGQPPFLRPQPHGIDVPDVTSEHDGVYILPREGGLVRILGYSDYGDSWCGGDVPIQAVIHALLPDDVRSYLSDLIDANDGDEAVEWGHPEDVRERAIALLFKPKEG